MDRGSLSRKWDLHIHTPASFEHSFSFSEDDREKFEDIWEKYIDELEKITDIKVIGITDYFSIEGYEKILEYRRRGRLQNFDLILPNIELRLDKIISGTRGGDSRRLNYHVIFSDEVSIANIKTEFLQELHIINPSGENRSLTKENIEAVGKLLKQQHSNFTGTNYNVGCQHITCSLGEIVNILHDKSTIFGGRYLLVLPEEGWNLIDWDSQDHLVRKNILVKSHAIFSSNSNTREWALGNRHETVEEFVDEFGSLKPCIHGSDAHSFNKLCKPDLNRFCWIKADSTFEGLKQIIHEPDERVKIQDDTPESRKNIYTLSSVKIINSQINEELEIEETLIPLNSNLVTVIGGKGSGKTALLDLIANCFEDRCKRKIEDKNSFVQRIEDQKPELEIEISFLGDDVENFSKELKEENFFTNSKITYLPQGKIEEYSSDRATLHKKITELIFSNKEVSEADHESDYDLITEKINDLQREVRKINSEVYGLELETKPEIIDEIEREKKFKGGQLKDKSSKLEDLKSSIEGDSTEKVEMLKQEENKLRLKHSKLEILEENLLRLRSQIEAFTEVNSEIQEVNSDLADLDISFVIPEVVVEGQLEIIDKSVEAIKEEIIKTSEEIQKKVEESKEFSEVEQTHKSVLEEIDDIRKDIDTKNLELKELNRKKSQIEELEKIRKEKFVELIENFFDLKYKYEEIIEEFSVGKDVILSDIEFQASISCDTEKFLEMGDDILHGRKVSDEDLEQIANNLEKMINCNYDDIQTEVENYISETIVFKENMKTTRSSNDFYDWMFNNYFSLSTEIFFNKILMNKLSIGQKGTVLLKIFLAEGDYPLLVDQPEENLDNKFVYESLVGSFREAKKKRQIIIATHNANLVVNTDAEQVIVAEFENNKISYLGGSIENPQKRKNITTLLEGGEEAFKKRELKYSIIIHPI